MTKLLSIYEDWLVLHFHRGMQKEKICGSQWCSSVIHTSIVPLNSDHWILNSGFPSPLHVQLRLPGTFVQTQQQPQSVSSHNFKECRSEIKIIGDNLKTEFKLLDNTGQQFLYCLFFCPFFIHFGQSTWVSCKEITAPAFAMLFDLLICCSLHTHVLKDILCHLAPASSIPADILHSFSMLAMNFLFCMWWLEQGLLP